MLAARAARAQCPDGTPPPCAARAAAPRLDERTWIVLPFENVAHVADVDWLRDLSVNLLYLELSRWRDIHVIDDERVADLLRQAPGARAGTLGLETGLAVARRAGAGRLVMGDVLRAGTRTALVAKVFDARSGRRLRTAREEVAVADSAMPAFGRLARAVLELGAAAGSGPGSVAGTASLDAYRAYAAGVAALNSWNLEVADTSFRRALALDTGFALAHYKLSVVMGWLVVGRPGRRTGERLRHAEAAARLSGTLPPRERALITGHLAQAQGRWANACETYAALLRTDSSDVEAWYNLGECSFHDPEVATDPADTSASRFRSSWNTALRAMVRALELDPTYHLAFQHVQDILQAGRRSGCRERSPGVCGEAYAALVHRAGDTLVTAPLPPRQRADLMRQASSPAWRAARRANLVLARDLAARWVASAPQEGRAHLAYARALLAAGDPTTAAREFAAAREVSSGENAESAADRVVLLLKLDSVDAARLLMDSLFTANQNSEAGRLAAATLGTVFGRFRLLERLLPPGLAPGRYFTASAQLAAGLLPESLDAIEREFDRFAVGPGAAMLGLPLTPEVLLGTRVVSYPMRTAIPGLDTLGDHPTIRLIAALTSADRTRGRLALAAFDSVLAALPMDVPDDGWFFLSAEGHVGLGDSARALERLLEFERRWPLVPLRTGFGLFNPVVAIWGRTSLRLGDLSMALGRRDDAVRAYRRVVGLWRDAEPEIQPFVARARAALAQLGAN